MHKSRPPASRRIALPYLVPFATACLTAQQEPAPTNATGPAPRRAEGTAAQDPQPQPPQTQPPQARPPQGEPRETPPVVVTATRTAEDPLTTPHAVSIIGQERILEGQYRTTPQAMRDIPSVMVQETSPGQGSPFVRGFTGYNNLFLIDGIRLNNSVFRAGPNQYWNTVDPLSIDRLEVVKGPAASLWGSDAVGGTVQAITKSPWTWSAHEGFASGGSTYVRYATAEDSIWGRAEVSAGNTFADGSQLGVLIGGDAKSFGDLEGGDDTGTQLNTNYDENAVDFKVEHRLAPNRRLVFLHQQVDQDKVPRTHSTTAGESFRGSAVGTDQRRDLYQDRRLTYLQYHDTGLDSGIDGVHLSVSWHEQEEREFRVPSNGNGVQQGFEVGTLGAFLQAESDLGDAGRLTYGVDYYRDDVDSFTRRNTGQTPADDIQGAVADDATYDLFGVFVQDAIAIGDRAELFLGGRYTYASADADSVRDPATNTQIGISDDWDEFTGNARLRIDLEPKTWNVYAGVSQGFRAPNLSDLSSFDTARSGEQEIPSPGLEPEHYLGYEIGTKVRNETLSGQAAWYYTDIEDQILRYPTGTTNASGQPIVTKDNVGDGYVQGVELEGGWRFVEQTTLFGAFSWQYGRVSNYNTAGSTLSNEYISRMMPLTTMLGVRWDDIEDRGYVETAVIRAEDADKLSSGDVRDTQRIPPGGTPSYTIWNIHAGWRLSEQASLDVGLDNITDVDYRVHGSGSNSLGRNFILGMRVTF